MTRTILPAPLGGSIKAMASKSCAHRLLICAALAGDTSVIDCGSLSRDIQASADCLRAIGAQIDYKNSCFHIARGDVKNRCILPCGESGTTLRFLLPIVAALGLEADFVMDGRLPERPLAPLDEQLEKHGVKLEKPMRHILRCTGKLQAGNYVLPGNVSSQFISGLLLALPLLDAPSTLTVTGEVESAAYIDMTLSSLKQFGVHIPAQNRVYFVPAATYVSPGNVSVEGDWSNAAFWLCAAALGKSVTVTGLDCNSLQGDKAICGLLECFGARCSLDNDSCTVSAAPLHAAEIDASNVPDLIPALSVVAAAAEGTTRIYHASRLRLKESDRLVSIRQMLENFGTAVEETADGLLIHGGKPLQGCTVDSFGDHRIAMAAAIAASVATGPVTVLGAEAVEKSYPQFWDDYMALRSAL